MAEVAEISWWPRILVCVGCVGLLAGLLGFVMYKFPEWQQPIIVCVKGRLAGLLGFVKGLLIPEISWLQRIQDFTNIVKGLFELINYVLSQKVLYVIPILVLTMIKGNLTGAMSWFYPDISKVLEGFFLGLALAITLAIKYFDFQIKKHAASADDFFMMKVMESQTKAKDLLEATRKYSARAEDYATKLKASSRKEEED